MATIRKRNGKYQVQVRVQGCNPISKTFTRLDDAKTWARLTEIEAEQIGLPADPRVLARTTVGQLLERYRDEVVPKKRGSEYETIMVNAMLRQPWSKRSLAHIDGATFAEHRDIRLRTVLPCTVKRELAMLQHAFDIAMKEWSIPLRSNPIKSVSKPGGANKRDRRVRKGELIPLFRAAKQCKRDGMRALILLAIETGMRQGELLAAKWSHIDLAARRWLIPVTKNGESRTIPLTRRCVRTLRILKKSAGTADRIFDLTREAVKCSWRRVIERSQIEDLNFHDLRHEAISRFFERGLSIPEVSLISGHKDPRMLFRYTHMTAAHVLAKLG
ncbi:site-specific integrase [Neorhizobium sp. T7_12]|uniref:site-specific integrase n=1 Tax=Neorhizobium sp. T7_12 TaxID=2093832 RepID=UPI000CF9ECE6|nr:site-specific integrase [Neorhizobium sp. T7_12]